MNLFGAFKKQGPSEVQDATANVEQYARDLREVIRLARRELTRQERTRGAPNDGKRAGA